MPVDRRRRRCGAAPEPLVLASKSASRRALLSAAGLDAEVVAAEVDERALEDRYLAAAARSENVALELARAKALAVSAERPDAYCLGADQTLTLEGRIFHKARDLAEAAQTLAALSGKTHRLTSAFCVARGGQALVVDSDHADLRMRPLDPAAISRYLERAGRRAGDLSAAIRSRVSASTSSSASKAIIPLFSDCRCWGFLPGCGAKA